MGNSTEDCELNLFSEVLIGHAEFVWSQCPSFSGPVANPVAYISEQVIRDCNCPKHLYGGGHFMALDDIAILSSLLPSARCCLVNAVFH